jgi:hypothetical protein
MLCLLLGFSIIGSGTRTFAQTSTAGTWTHFPEQTTQYTVSVRAPIKLNGSSQFNTGSIIPLRFNLFGALNSLRFESVWSDDFPEGQEGNFDNQFAFVSFKPASAITFNDVHTLKANYEFTEGNCGGGSLRWSITFDINNDNANDDPEDPTDGTANDRSVFIYYGGYPNFDECTLGANDQSGVNMLEFTDLRFDTSQVGGTFYDSYANAQSLVAGLTIASVSLAVDSGWRQNELGEFLDQRVDLASAEVNGNVFVPLSGDVAQICANLPTASINIVEDVNGTVENPASVQQKFEDTVFGTSNDCTYSYNLSSNSLFGPGQYAAFVVINGQALQTPARFKLK